MVDDIETTGDFRQMTISYVERRDASADTISFYERSQDRFYMLLNLFKVMGHTPELGKTMTDLILALLKNGALDLQTKELLILKAVHQKGCKFSVAHHETYALDIGISEEKIEDIAGYRYRSSPYFTEAEKALLDFVIQVGTNVHQIENTIWDRIREYFSESQIVEAVLTVTVFSALSDFGGALGVSLEPVFEGMAPILPRDPHGNDYVENSVDKHYTLKLVKAT